MIKSMTGYGRGESKDERVHITAEIKTLNHKYNDIIIRLPRKLSCFEEKLRSMVKEHVQRGRVEVSLHMDEVKGTDVHVAPNEALIEQLVKSLRAVGEAHGLDSELKLEHLLGFGDILTMEPIEEDQELLWGRIESSMEEALETLSAMRLDEGARMAADITQRIETVALHVESIAGRIPFVVQEYKEKLKGRIDELLKESGTQIDESRLALEVAIYADRSDITEEIVRMRSHLAELGKMATHKGPIGRKLDFMMQEMNREVNTMGSKSQDSAIVGAVIELKSELSKIREQIQNIE